MLRINSDEHNSKYNTLHTQLLLQNNQTLLQRHMDKNQHLQQKLFVNEKELIETKATLAETRKELDATKKELEEVKVDCDQKQNEIQANLAETQNQLQVTKKNLNELQIEFNVTKERLLQSENKVKDLLNELDETNTTLKTMEEQFIRFAVEIIPTPNQLFKSIESKQPIMMDIIKPINIGNDKLELDQINKHMSLKTFEEKTELLLSKMNQGIVHNVDEKQIFFKLRFEVSTYQQLFVYCDNIKQYKNQNNTKFFNDNFALRDHNGESYDIIIQLNGWGNKNSTPYLFNVKDETKEKLTLVYGWNNNIDFKNYLSQNNEVLIVIKRK